MIVIEDDWFTFFWNDGENTETDEPHTTWIHEFCCNLECAYTGKPCKFHPKGCDCSNGSCQDTSKTFCDFCNKTHVSDIDCLILGSIDHKEQGLDTYFWNIAEIETLLSL